MIYFYLFFVFERAIATTSSGGFGGGTRAGKLVGAWVRVRGSLLTESFLEGGVSTRFCLRLKEVALAEPERFLRTDFGGGIRQAAMYSLRCVLMRRKRRGRAHLLSVVDFPDEGLPTRPIRGSRGIMDEDYANHKRSGACASLARCCED